MSTKDLIVAICAVVGAVLGIFNLWRNYLADSERLRVSVIPGDQDSYPGVEVVNVSPFPVTVVEIGEVHPDGQVSKVAIQIMNSKTDPLPRRIDSRHSSRFRIGLREVIARNVYRPRYTYVRTALGGIFTSEAQLTRWARRAKELLHVKENDLDRRDSSTSSS